MKKSKKLIALVLTAVLFTGTILTGCGSSNTGNNTTEEVSQDNGSEAAGTTEDTGSQATGEGKITIFQQKTEIYDALKEMAAAYQEETGVEVEVWQISGDDYYQNLKTYLSSESGPTIFSLNSSTEIAEVSAYLEDIGSLSFMGNIEEDLLAKVDGKTVGIPMTAEGFGLVYNKSLVSPEEVNSTAALVSYIESASADGIAGLGLSEEAYFLIGHILNTPFALQGDPAAFCQSVYNGEASLADVAEFKELADVFAAIRANQKNPLEVSYDDNCGDFATGKTAMIHQGNWCYSLFSSYDMDFDIGVMALPLNGNKSIAVGVPSVWCVNTDAADNEKALAKDFLNWLYGSETGSYYLMEKFGFIPVVSGMESENLDPLSQQIAQAVAEGNIIPWTFNEEWPAGIVTTYLVQVAQEFFTSDMSTDEFLNALNEAFVTAANE